MKKIISLSLMFILCFGIITGCGKKKENDKPEQNNPELHEKEEVNEDGTLKEDINSNKGVIEDKNVDGITIHNVELKSTTYSSTLTISAKNNTDSDITLEYFKVYLKDKDGNNILGEGSFAVATVFGTIESSQEKILNVDFDRDLSNVYDIEYEMVK